MKFYLLPIIGLTFLSISAQARPVSYPGGITFMAMNNGEVNSGHIHYSPSAKTSFGYKFEYWRDDEVTIHAGQMNNLLKRWNMPAAQANLYAKSGIGIGHSSQGVNDGESNLVGYTGFAADWENRRFFVSYENRYTHIDAIDDFYMQHARVGVAPYIGEYGDLHTWLMVEVGHMPEDEDNFVVKPLVRFFKDVHLLEAGMNNHGEILFNYIIRY